MTVAVDDTFAGIAVVDRLALQDLVARYSLARDDRDIETLIGHFTPDAEFERAGTVVSGREEITKFFLASMKRYDLTIHTTHTQVLDRVGVDEISGVVTGHAELVMNGRLNVASYRYYDRYERQSDTTWKIGRRWLRFLYAMPVEALGTGFSTRERIRWPGSTAQPGEIPESLPTWWQ